MNDSHQPGHSHDSAAAPKGDAGHRHPHAPDDPSGRPRIGFIGAGRVGCALAVAFGNAGWPVSSVCTRDAEREARFLSLVPSAQAASSIAALADEVDLIFVTVPDDALPDVAARLRLYAGQAAVHTSGALGSDVLEPARAAGTSIGSFHPLVAFADQEAALAALPGATVALEGDEELLALLGQLVTDLGGQPVRLPPSGKQAYHAAAVLAAGGFVGLLDAIAEVARGAGLDEAGALAIYAPLIRQSLGNAERVGIDGALTGPFVRGDEGTVRAHLAALARLAPGALELYRAVARRELAIAVDRGELDAEGAAAMARLLEDA
ncbi:MAG: Rossmann-like and DUF2520 domain-containing protein [Chloroflexota bacterium]